MTGHGMGGWRGDEWDGTDFNGKSAVQGFSFWSHQPLLISSSVFCHVVLLVGRALSWTCMWTWKHVNKMDIKTVTKECHSVKADVHNLCTINRFQGDNDPDILCKIMGTYLHMHSSIKIVYSTYVAV